MTGVSEQEERDIRTILKRTGIAVSAVFGINACVVAVINRYNVFMIRKMMWQ
jgi:hypothetical protein